MASRPTETRMATGLGVKADGDGLVKITLARGRRGLFVYLDHAEASALINEIASAIRIGSNEPN